MAELPGKDAPLRMARIIHRPALTGNEGHYRQPGRCGSNVAEGVSGRFPILISGFPLFGPGAICRYLQHSGVERRQSCGRARPRILAAYPTLAALAGRHIRSADFSIHADRHRADRCHALHGRSTVLRLDRTATTTCHSAMQDRRPGRTPYAAPVFLTCRLPSIAPCQSRPVGGPPGARSPRPDRLLLP